MLITMLSNYAGPRGTALRGNTIDLPDSEAKQLVQDKHAVPGRQVITRANAGPTETANLKGK